MRLDPKARLAARFRAEPGAPARLAGPDGRTLLVDDWAHALFSRADGRRVAELVGEGDAEATYAALCVLVRAGALEADPAPAGAAPHRPPPRLPAEPPLVSLVVVAYNSGRDLATMLRSLAAQTYPRLETIVVDNHSTDGSIEALEPYWPQVRFLRRPRNGGFADAVNAGVEHAQGAWVGVLNADLELEPDAVAAWVERALASPGAGAVAAKMMLASHPRFINSIGNSIVRMAWGSDNFMGVLDEGQFDGVEEVWGACFGAVLLSREALDRVGPLDPEYFLYYEDLDWCYRARLAGYRVVTAPGCVIRHQFGGSVGQRHDTWKLGLVVRNRMRYVLLNMRWRLALGLLARYVYMDLRQLAKALVTRNPHAVRMYAKAYLWLLAWAPDILRRRRRNRRFPISKADEARAFQLNIEPTADSHLGREALLSRAAIERRYRDLFRPPRLTPAGDGGSGASGRRSGPGRRGGGRARPS